MTGTSKFLSYDSCLREEFNKHLSYCYSSAIAQHPFLFDPVFFQWNICFNMLTKCFYLKVHFSYDLVVWTYRSKQHQTQRVEKNITKVIKDFMSKITFTETSTSTVYPCFLFTPITKISLLPYLNVRVTSKAPLPVSTFPMFTG